MRVFCQLPSHPELVEGCQLPTFFRSKEPSRIHSQSEASHLLTAYCLRPTFPSEQPTLTHSQPIRSNLPTCLRLTAYCLLSHRSNQPSHIYNQYEAISPPAYGLRPTAYFFIGEAFVVDGDW